MAWTRYQMFLAALMVVTGSINTLVTSYTDEVVAAGREGGKFWNSSTNSTEDTINPHKFKHPFLQATGMFIGEFSCLVFFKIMMLIHSKRNTPESELPDMLQGNRDFNVLIFYLPALCDMVGTSLMYIGLNMTYASSFQMFRGAVIIFTGLFSMIFLKRRLHRFKWLGILFVLIGLIIVGVANYLYAGSDNKNNPEGTKDASSVMIGNLIIVFAQVISATQMVLEEKFVSASNVPALQAVGWEGFFGMTTLGVLLIPLFFIKSGSGIPIDDSLDGLVQIFTDWHIALGFGGTLLSISFFNYAGVSVTKQMSATTRMVLDSVRTIIIWAFSLGLLGEVFHFEVVIGFVILLSGMAIYNNLFFVPFMAKRGWVTNPEDEEQDDDTEQFIDAPRGSKRDFTDDA